jgi:FkbM family methyltransferase
MVKEKIKTFIEARPIIWDFAWRTLHSSNIFLPHDPCYYSLPHLIHDRSATILDIGANQGISALSFSKLCPKAKIISFEPNIALESNLVSVSKRIKNFEFHMIGLGDAIGEFQLFVPRYKNIYLHTFSSLDRALLEQAIIQTYNSSISDAILIESFICKVATLDSFEYSPSVIKVDAEGFEDKIFLGGEVTIRKSKPSIIFEAVHNSLERIIKTLHNFEYEIFSYDSKCDVFHSYRERDGVPYISGSRNLIAIPKDIKDSLKIA